MNLNVKKKTKIGMVVSDNLNKTKSILVERKINHKLYKKKIKVSKKFLFHDEYNQTSVGDKVKIIECRPISKCKSWRLFEIINKVNL